MKHTKKVLAIVLSMLMLASILPALPLTAGAWNFSTDGYFSWSEAGDPGVGVALLPLPPFTSGELNIHYLNGRFYCDPECKVELIGVGFDHRSTGGLLSWAPVVRDDRAIRGQNLAGPAGSGDVACESPATISQLLAKLNFAIDCMYNNIVLVNTNPNDPEMRKLQGVGTNIAIDTLFTLNLTLHSPYTVNVNEWGYGNYESANAHNVFWGATASFGPTSAAPAWPVPTYVYEGRGVWGRFGGNINIIRGSEVRGVLIDVPSSGVAPSADGFRDELEIHFAPGDKTTIDNNTTLDTDIAIRVGENNLLHFENCKITNSQYAEETQKDLYHGTAIQLVGNSVDLEGNANPEGNGAVELGLDTGGSCVIEKNGVGVDALAGICRFKAPKPDQPYTLADNKIAINMRHGTYLAKWTDDISMLDAFNVMITVEDPTVWVKGDPILCSGMSRVRNGEPAELHYTPITEEDLSVIEFQYAGNLMNVFGLKFVPRDDVNNDYTYPRYVLAGDGDWTDGQIYNPRLNRWYTSLTNAVYDQTIGGIRLLQDGDTLIYFDDVNEQRAVLIDKGITVRAAKAGDAQDIAYGETAQTPKVISAAGYTAKWFNTRRSGSFIQIASGVTVTFGGTDSGTFNIDCNNEGRFAEIISGGTFNLESNVNVLNAAIRSDDTIKVGSAIYQNGTFNVAGNFNLNGATVYLPVGKVIQKANTFTNNIVVTLADTPEGRDILVSGGATVEAGDNAKIIESAALPTGTLQQYTADGADAGKTYSAGTPVIELVLAQYTVTYTDGVDGIVIFADDIWSGRKHGTATPAASAAVTGALTTRDGYDFAGWEPVVAATVTCTVTYEAQWKPYIWIHHSSTPSAEPSKYYPDVDENGDMLSFDITVLVYANYLYGGLATDATFATPADPDVIGGNGLDLTPEADGHYFLREVSEIYLRPAIISVKPHSSTPHNEIKHYLVTVIDANGLDITDGQVGDAFYTEYGFAFDKNNIVDSSLTGQVYVDDTEDGDKNAANYNLYETIGVYKFQDAGTNPQLEKAYKPSEVFGSCLDTDYFGVAALEDNDNFADIEHYLKSEGNGEKSFTFAPYYVTADGVVVTGAWELVVNTNTKTTAPTTTPGKNGSVCEAQEGGLLPQAPARMSGFMVSKTFAMIPKTTAPKINVSVIANGIQNQLSVAAGNIAGKVTAPAISGMIFAGWYSDAGFRTAADLSNVQSDLTVFGKYISAKYFNTAVITSISKGKLCKLRFVTAIDDINYAEYGMNITVNGETTNYVLTKTYASVSGYKAQKIFGTDVASNAKLLYRDIATDNFADGTVISVTPYFITLDGTTINGMTAEMICHAGSIEMR